jgi:hypothetical protein
VVERLEGPMQEDNEYRDDEVVMEGAMEELAF